MINTLNWFVTTRPERRFIRSKSLYLSTMGTARRRSESRKEGRSIGSERGSDHRPNQYSVAVAPRCCLTLRSTGPATAGQLGPVGGTRYIFANRAKPSCRSGPVTSNVGPRRLPSQRSCIAGACLPPYPRPWSIRRSSILPSMTIPASIGCVRGQGASPP